MGFRSIGISPAAFRNDLNGTEGGGRLKRVSGAILDSGWENIENVLAQLQADEKFAAMKPFEVLRHLGDWQMTQSPKFADLSSLGVNQGVSDSISLDLEAPLVTAVDEFHNPLRIRFGKPGANGQDDF